MGVLITKKGKKKESSAPVLDILEATIKILSAEYLATGDIVTKSDGSTFTVEKPHISCELEVVDTDPSAKQHIGPPGTRSSTTRRPRRALGSMRTARAPR